MSRLLAADSARPRLWPYALAYIGLCAQIGTMFPFLQLYWESQGCSVAQVSRISLCVALTALLMQQVWGYVADTLLTRRLALLTLIVPAAIFLAANYLVPQAIVNAIGSFASFALLGVMLGATMTPQTQLLNGLTFGDPNAAPHFPWMRATGSVAFVATNLGTGWLIEHHDNALWLSWPLFFLFMPLTLIGTWAAPSVPQERVVEREARPPLAGERGSEDATLALEGSAPKPPGPPKRLSFAQVQRTLAGNKPMRRALILSVLYQVPFVMSYNTFQPFLVKKEMGLGTDVVAWCYSLGAIAEIPFIMASGAFIRRIGAAPCFAVAAGMSSLRWFLAAGATTAWGIVSLSLLHSVTFGLFYASMVIYVNERADNRLKASAQTLLGIIYFSFSAILAAFVAQWMLDGLHLSVRQCFTAAGWIAVVAFVYATWLWATEKKSDAVPLADA